MTQEAKPKEIADPLAGLVPGRSVRYTPTATEARQAGEDNGGPWAATVTKAGGPIPGVVTLNIEPPVTLPIGTDPVQRRAGVPYSAEGAPGSWCWNPKS